METEQTTQQQQGSVAPEPTGTPVGVPPEAPKVVTPPVETVAAPAAPVAPAKGAVPDEVGTLRQQIQKLEGDIRAVKSTKDRQMYELEQRYRQQMTGLQEKLYKRETADMTEDERLRYEYARMQKDLARQQEDLGKLQQERQQQVAAQQYYESLVAYYRDQGIPQDVLMANAGSPQQMQQAVIDYLRAQKEPAPQPTATTPSEPLPQRPAAPPVTSHASAAQPTTYEEDMSDLRDRTNKDRKDTTVEAVQRMYQEWSAEGS